MKRIITRIFENPLKGYYLKRSINTDFCALKFRKIPNDYNIFLKLTHHSNIGNEMFLVHRNPLHGEYNIIISNAS